MRRDLLPSPLSALLSGLMLAACGGPTEDLSSPEEHLGSQEAAMCSVMSVNSLTVDNMTSWGGELAGSGTWSTSTYANSIYLEISVDNGPASTQKIPASSYDSANGLYRGTWSFSAAGMSCGSHTVVLKAWPRNVNSAGLEEVCTSNTPVTTSYTVTQACPTATLSCSTSGSSISCNGSASGGVPSYTPFWQTRVQYSDGSTYTDPWQQGTWSYGDYCAPLVTRDQLSYRLTISFKVRDSSGMDSLIRSYIRTCAY